MRTNLNQRARIYSFTITLGRLRIRGSKDMHLVSTIIAYNQKEAVQKLIEDPGLRWFQDHLKKLNPKRRDFSKRRLTKALQLTGFIPKSKLTVAV